MVNGMSKKAPASEENLGIRENMALFNYRDMSINA